MLYILGEFQALPINIRFPLQKFLTVNFSVREAAPRRDEERAFVRRGDRRRVLPENISYSQELALPFPHATQGNPEGEKQAVTHRL